MTRIYTCTGDSGTTATHGGERVSKTHPRIEAVGELDDLNSAIGAVRAFLPEGHKANAPLRQVQLELMKVMSLVATPARMRPDNPNRPDGGEVERLERLIDRFTPSGAAFILPGGTRPGALMHLARTAARRAERRLWALHESDPVDSWITAWVNRLSDLLYALALHDAESSGHAAEVWREFGYRKAIKNTTHR